MFSLRRPTTAQISRFLDQSRDLPLSYSPTGVFAHRDRKFRYDAAETVVGRGEAVFADAVQALESWQQFDLGWIEVFPKRAACEPGTTVVVLIRHLGLWSLNGCRVVYRADSAAPLRRGFAYGTLTNHAECGEELFQVRCEPVSETVTYVIRAASHARHPLARLGLPIVRRLQARFRRDSMARMQAIAMPTSTNG